MDILVVNNSLNELPKYARQGDAGMDLRADFSQGINEDLLYFSAYDSDRNVVIIFPGGRALIPTNLRTALPEGYEAQIRPRSGMALKHGISVLNTPGTIDGGYRNDWGVILINLGDEEFEVAQGDRVAQVVLNKFEEINWVKVAELPPSERGLTGFGDSGKN